MLEAAAESWSSEWEESLSPRTRRILLGAVDEDVDENAHAVELRLLTAPSRDQTPDEREEPVRGALRRAFRASSDEEADEHAHGIELRLLTASHTATPEEGEEPVHGALRRALRTVD